MEENKEVIKVKNPAIGIAVLILIIAGLGVFFYFNWGEGTTISGVTLLEESANENVYLMIENPALLDFGSLKIKNVIIGGVSCDITDEITDWGEQVIWTKDCVVKNKLYGFQEVKVETNIGTLVNRVNFF